MDRNQGAAPPQALSTPQIMSTKCRFCGGGLHEFLDLGMSPPCESFVPAERLNGIEAFYPLRLCVCESCRLVQLPAYLSPAEIFTEYAYFSSYSDAYVAHGKAYAETMTRQLGLDGGSLVVELASNDGYLLQHFVAADIPVLGIEPAANVARAAEARGVPSWVRFFDQDTAQDLVAQRGKADLVIGNNVLAQVPDLNSFVAGIKIILAEGGLATLEFPHLLHLLDQVQYDTIYHEHFSYFSLETAQAIFAAHGMRIFDVDRIWTHGGSLRIHACHQDDASRPDKAGVAAILAEEKAAGLDCVATYDHFAEACRESKRALLDFLIAAKRQGKIVAGYGAPGKGNTLLNYCGIRTDFIDYTVDRNPYKHGLFLPGTHIPIHPPEHLFKTRPDYVLILPWNLRHEIVASMAGIRDWGGRFVVPIPTVEVLD